MVSTLFILVPNYLRCIKCREPGEPGFIIARGGEDSKEKTPFAEKKLDNGGSIEYLFQRIIVPDFKKSQGKRG
jgi:hypothetical protein